MLGPLLLVIYINNLDNIVGNMVSRFADTLKVVVEWTVKTIEKHRI